MRPTLFAAPKAEQLAKVSALTRMTVEELDGHGRGKVLVACFASNRTHKLPPFARKAILDESKRQVEAASAAGLNVEWKISDPVAAQKLQGLFSQENVNVMITYLPE